MPHIGSASPALSDADLRETIDLMSTVLASLSDRVDSQTVALDRLNKTATEARQAAFAARSQTDPKRYGQLVGETIKGEVADSIGAIVKAGSGLMEGARFTMTVLDKAQEDKLAILRDVRAREENAARLKRVLPWLGLSATILAIAMMVTLPRFMVNNDFTCGVIGGEWLRFTNGQMACVFYVE